MPTPTRSRRPTKTTAAKKATAGKPKKAAAKSASAKAAPAAAKKPAVKKPAVGKAGLRISENDRCASVARMLQRALRRHPKLKGVRVVAKAARLSFFEVPEESVEAFATILERMWSRIRRYVE
jgi:hypothetical protein